MTSSTSSIPKAVLYHWPGSIWSSVALLCLEEKGYGGDEVDLRVVDLAKGENFAPTFLRLNPKATVPVLVVPLQKTLTEDVESRFRAITETKSIVEFLDKSRSATSRTRTTSVAPAPALSPATMAFTATTTKIIDEILHSYEASPSLILYMNARDTATLRVESSTLLPYFEGRNDALVGCLKEAEDGKIQVSEKTKAFWREKQVANKALLDVMRDAKKSDTELDTEGKMKRAEYFKEAKITWEVNLRDVFTKLNGEIMGPFCLGDQLSIADLHLAAWLARVVKASGGTAADDGNTAITKLGVHIGAGFALPKDFILQESSVDGQMPSTQNKLAAFWDAIKQRESWKKVYKNGLV